MSDQRESWFILNIYRQADTDQEHREIRSELELQHMVRGPGTMKTFILDNLLRIICEHKQTRSTDDQWAIQIILSPNSILRHKADIVSGCM